MELPGNGGDADKLWNFVAAHVEDKWRKKPCPLAEKAWKQLTGKVMVGYKPGRVVGGIPCAMPGRLASWRRQGGVDSVVDWSEKYVYAEGRGSEKALTGRWRRSYTARDLELHYIRCGHRMSAKESGNVLRKAEGSMSGILWWCSGEEAEVVPYSETTRVGDARDVPGDGASIDGEVCWSTGAE